MKIPTWAAPFASLAEKAASTYVQALIVVILASDTWDIGLWTAAAVAAVPAGLTVIANGLPALPDGLPFAADALLRVVRTTVAAVLGVLIAMPVFTLDATTWEAVVAAAGTGALAGFKAILARRVGDPSSAAVLPARLDPAARPAG
jgi:hypothetical protein